MHDSFGKLLRHYRKEHGLSQKQLREELEELGYQIKSNGTISKWEGGINKPSAEIVEALEDIYSLQRGTLSRAAGYLVETPGITPIENACQVAPIITKRREEHFNNLAHIVEGILGDDLDTVEPTQGQDQYILSSRLENRIWAAWEHYRAYDMKCLIDHLKAEYEDISFKGLQATIRDNPSELVATLQMLARRRFFKGKCSVCKDWQ